MDKMNVYEKFKRSLYDTRGEMAPGTVRLLRPGPAINVLLPSVATWDEKVGNVTLGQVLTLKNLLGTGSYGHVYKATVLVKEPKEKTIDVAVKITDKLVTLNAPVLAETMAHNWLSSNDRCSPVMMCLYATFVTKIDKSQQGWNYGLVMPLMDGDLFRLTASYNALTGMSPERRFARLMYMTLAMVYSLGYMHSRGWAHNDVKPDNFLYTKGEDKRLTIKISDFGFACANFSTSGSTTNREKINETIKNFVLSTGSDRAGRTPLANEECTHYSTRFYQMPSWDNVAPGSRTPDIQDNFKNDTYCIVMSAKAMFIRMGFDMAKVVAPYARPVAGKEARAQLQINAWHPDAPKLFSERCRHALRNAIMPYEFLDMTMRNIGYRFSRTLHQMSEGEMLAPGALGYLAEEVSDALKVTARDA